MRPLTLATPKVLLPVAGKPFLDWQLGRLRACGYFDVVLCIAHLGDQVVAYAGDGARFGMRIRYAHEGEALLGTGGALRQAVALLEDTFLITYGDSYLPFDYAAPLQLLRASDDAEGVMSIYRNASRYDASNVRASDTWVLAYEKGTQDPAFDFIDYGALALRRRVVEAILPGHSGLEAVQKDLASRGKMRAVIAEKRFFEVGSINGLADLEQYLYETKA
jgi:N-acetyl-alpha-D-muramate 1-phosphate uridylyltransferase